MSEDAASDRQAEPRTELAEIVWDEARQAPAVVLHRRGPDAESVSTDSLAAAESLLTDLGFRRGNHPLSPLAPELRAGKARQDFWWKQTPSLANCLEEASSEARRDADQET